MLGFGTPKPNRVTEAEMQDIRRKLSTVLDKKEEQELALVFNAALREEGHLTEGISREEYKLGMEELRTHGQLEERELALVERYFEEHLKD